MSTSNPLAGLPAPGVNNRWFSYSDSDLVLVFVHGLMSDSRSCWLNESEQPSVYWPDLIQKDNKRFPSMGLYLGGYYTARNSGAYGARDCARDLFRALKLPDGEGCLSVMSKRNIVFVCHSAGGIVVRYMLYKERDEFKDKHVGIVLIASPSNGSAWADRLKMITAFYHHRFGVQLRPDSWMLSELDDNFKNLARDEKRPFELHGVEAYENHSIFHTGIFRRVIVEKESAGRYFAEPILLPNTDHFTSVKPRDRDHPAHQLLLEFILEHFSGDASKSKSPRGLGEPDTRPLPHDSVQRARHLDALKRLLQTVKTDVDDDELYVLCRATLRLSSLPAEPGQDAILERLFDAPDRSDGIPRYAEFLERLADYADRKYRTGATVREWLDKEFAGRMTRLRSELDEQASAPVRFLLIVVNEGEHRGSIEIQRAFLHDQYRTIQLQWNKSDMRGFASHQEAISELLRQSSILWEESELWIEFAVTRNLLLWDPDLLELELGSEIKRALGHMYPVVLRWIDRHTPGRLHALWTKAAQRIKHRIHAGDGSLQPIIPTWVSEQPMEYGEFLTRLEAGVAGSFFAFTFVPKVTKGPNMLMAVLAGGAPYACWLRNEPQNWMDVRAGIERLLGHGAFDELPIRLQAYRNGLRKDYQISKFCPSFTLLWDDPGRNPLEGQLTEATQRTT